MTTSVKLKAEINLCFCVSLRKLIHSFILPSLLRIFLNMGSGKKTDVLYHIYNINYQQPQNVCSVYKTKKTEKCEKINLIVHRFNSQKNHNDIWPFSRHSQKQYHFNCQFNTFINTRGVEIIKYEKVYVLYILITA